MCVCVCVCVCVGVGVCVWGGMGVWVWVGVYVCVCVCVHTRVHASMIVARLHMLSVSHEFSQAAIGNDGSQHWSHVAQDNEPMVERGGCVLREPQEPEEVEGQHS